MADNIISINILGRVYPLNVSEENKPVILAAQKKLNELIERYRATYAYKDDKDLLAMSAIQFAIKTVIFDASQGSSETNLPVLEKLIEIEKLFEDNVK